MDSILHEPRGPVRLTSAWLLSLLLACSGLWASPPAGLAGPDSAGGRGGMDLLPDRLSPGERMFWGPHGLMRKLGDFPLTEEGRERELGLRRAMLTGHQVGGFVTLASMIATVVYGQMLMNGRDDLGDRHLLLAGTTLACYAITGSLALLTPPPIVRRTGWSTVSTHKALAWAHFTGMLVTPVLGRLAADGDRRELRRFHQVSAYATTAAFAGAMLVVTF